jgi:hypothetical protein
MKRSSMKNKNVRPSKPDPFLQAVGEGFATKIRGCGWTFEEADRATWLEALGAGYPDPKWKEHFHWYLGLTESIAHLAMALSLDGKGEKKVKREALLLAAVIASNSCHGQPSLRLEAFGKPCSGVTVDGFDNRKGDRERIVALYKDRYAPSGLPVCDCCATAASAVVRKSK